MVFQYYSTSWEATITIQYWCLIKKYLNISMIKLDLEIILSLTNK